MEYDQGIRTVSTEMHWVDLWRIWAVCFALYGEAMAYSGRYGVIGMLVAMQ